MIVLELKWNDFFKYHRVLLDRCRQVVLWIRWPRSWIFLSLRYEWDALLAYSDAICAKVATQVNWISKCSGPNRLEVLWKFDGCWEAVYMWRGKFWNWFRSHTRERWYMVMHDILLLGKLFQSIASLEFDITKRNYCNPRDIFVKQWHGSSLSSINIFRQHRGSYLLQ